MRSTGCASLLSRMLRCDWLVFSSCDWCISILAVSVCCSISGPLSYGSPVVVFLDRGHSCFPNFYSTIPVDVVRVKSYLNRLFYPVILIDEFAFLSASWVIRARWREIQRFVWKFKTMKSVHDFGFYYFQNRRYALKGVA